MTNHQFEVVYAGDFREPLSHLTTLADQLTTVAKAGYRTGLIQLSEERADHPLLIHQDIRRLIDEGCLTHLDPEKNVSSELLIVAAPSSFEHKPRRYLDINSNVKIIAVPNGTVIANGRETFDWSTIYPHAIATLGEDVIWAPMDPFIRAQLERLTPKPSLSAQDWYGCVDPAEWFLEREGFCSSRPVIGASGPPIETAWPNDANEIFSLYPDDPQILVKILDGGPILKDRIGPYPRNWETLASDDLTEREFLSSIDFFVYGHHPDYLSPISSSLLRAMASGAVAIMPPIYEPIFGEAAVYAEPHLVKTVVWNLYANCQHYLDISERGRKAIAEEFGGQRLIDRITKLIGPPDRDSVKVLSRQQPGKRVEATRGRRRVMFITINGVGMGHLTRMLAIAKRCPEPIEPVFVTMSQALKVLREQGYIVEFIPSRQYLDCDINHWNSFLKDELNEMISFYSPSVIVFDGNVPYQGLIDAIKANPDPRFIWSRRGMWRTDNTDIVNREVHFDVVLEPGDLAAVDDHGVTTRFRDRTHNVRPIRLLDEREMLSREDARSALGLDTERAAVLIQLGAGNNFDYRSIRNTAIAHIQKQYDAQIAVGEWLISDQAIDLPETIVRMPGYPFARYFKAFDLAISAVGYNSFHELLFAGIPTILVPNEAMEQDNQLSRALFAGRHGLAVCVRTKEIYRLTATIDNLFKSNERDSIKRRLRELDPANGASQAARLIEEMAYSRRVDRP